VKLEAPIHSLLEEDLAMRECVETFIYGLASHIDDLQEAELVSDLPEVERLGKDLAAGSSRAGYPSLVEMAETTISACQAEKAEEVRQGIVELTELAQRVRRGSRGGG
jgi:HPt (histidine-containing phosphotransfer) domain-containing protein